MSIKVFYLSFTLIILGGLLLRLLPARNNNFYFTIDQGNDAVYVREILERHQILLIGPETGIKGLYHGPLWFYFIAIGYALFAGHPFGAVFMLIILNLVLTAIIMLKIAKRVSRKAAILIGGSLQFFWWFYDTSRYAFNPFPLAFLSVIFIFILCDFLEDKKYALLLTKINSYTLAAIPIGLAFHFESAAAVGFVIFYFLLGIWGIFKKRLTLKTILAGVILLSLFFIPRIISELNTNFSQTRILKREVTEPKGVFSETRYQHLSKKFSELLARRITPQSTQVGIAVLAFTLLFFLRTPQKNRFIRNFTYLSLFLIIISWLWFGSNKGWQIWHTVYFRPIIFIAIILMLIDIKQRFLARSLLVAILIAQVLFFKERYLYFARPFNDPSLLTNELASIDWVYKNSGGLGFYVYSYLPSVYDYPYQYLFWWHGRKNYGYVPCEYSTFPNTPDLFVPGLKYYQEPKRDCTNLRFLIVERDKNEFLRNKWLDQVRNNTELLESSSIGEIQLEKRKII